MGWSIYIKTDKQLTEKIIEEVIADLPASMRQGGGKQRWGWSLAVDVTLKNYIWLADAKGTVKDEPRELMLSGSFGQSGMIAEGFAEAFARRLEKRGFKVNVGKMS